MIFRITSKLQKKIGLDSLPSIPHDKSQNPILDWSVHVFIAGRKQYIILSNTASLYSMIFLGRGITNDKKFIHEALSCMRGFMGINGYGMTAKKIIDPSANEVFFSKTTNRRVIGSMNDLIFQAKFFLDHNQSTPHDIMAMINNSPMSYLNYQSPQNEFAKLCSMHEK